MCILALAPAVLLQFPVVLIHQRVEEYSRETAPPALDGSSHVYASIDKLSGEAFETASLFAAVSSPALRKIGGGGAAGSQRRG